MKRPRYISLDGDIVPHDEARVHVSSAAFKFGTAVFEGIRGYWNEAHRQMYLFRMTDHMRRLVFSQSFMRFEEILDPGYVAERTVELIHANELREAVHVMATVYVKGFGGPATSAPVGLAITATPGVGPGFVDSGCSVQVSSWRRVADSAMPVRVKCNANYQNGRLAVIQSRADGYDTTLLMNAQGKLAEGPGMCFFMVRDGRAITPTITNDILESITRETVLELLQRDCGVETVERDIDRSELVAASEAFFCGTAWEVTPVVSIDRLPVGTGEVGTVVRNLQSRYFSIARGESDEHAEWRTPVY